MAQWNKLDRASAMHNASAGSVRCWFAAPFMRFVDSKKAIDHQTISVALFECSLFSECTQTLAFP